MKKLAVFFLIIIMILVGISYLYMNHKASYYEAQRENLPFQEYEGKEIYGSELTTIINKAVDRNEMNEVPKDEKGNYIENDKDSIKIQIKMLDNDKTYSMESLYGGGMDKFVKYYREIQFKCTKLEYHTTTNKVKYLLFEQVTQ